MIRRCNPLNLDLLVGLCIVLGQAILGFHFGLGLGLGLETLLGLVGLVLGCQVILFTQKSKMIRRCNTFGGSLSWSRSVFRSRSMSWSWWSSSLRRSWTCIVFSRSWGDGGCSQSWCWRLHSVN